MDRLIEQPAAKALSGEPVSGQRLLDGGVSLDHRRLIAAVPGDMRGRRLLGQLAEGFKRRPAADYQRTAKLFQAGRQALEGLVQPPLRGRSRLPGGFFVRGPDEDRHYPAAGSRSQHRRIVIQPQIVTKPDKGDSGHEDSRQTCVASPESLSGSPTLLSQTAP